MLLQKMGWGDCTENVMEDYSMKPFEDAFRVAWDSTAEVVGIVSDTVKSDLRQVGRTYRCTEPPR